MARIHEAICAMLAETEAICKNKENEQQHYMFRGVDDIYNSVHHLLAKHKVFSTSKITSKEWKERTTNKGAALLHTQITAQYEFFADDGSSVTTEVLGEGMDSGDKSGNKSMSSAYKYALVQLLCIPTLVIDPDRNSYQDLNGRQQPKPIAPPIAPPVDPVALAIKAVREANDNARLDKLQAAVKNRKWSKLDVSKVDLEITLRRQQLAAEETATT